MKRRTGLMMGVAGVAGLAGAGLAWWKFRPHDVADGALAGFGPSHGKTHRGSPSRPRPCADVHCWSTSGPLGVRRVSKSCRC